MKNRAQQVCAPATVTIWIRTTPSSLAELFFRAEVRQKEGRQKNTGPIFSRSVMGQVAESDRPPPPTLTKAGATGYLSLLMSAESSAPTVTMDAIVALAKRRGFVFQSSEIYGGLNGFFDYGPMGAELKKNIRDCWWDDMVRRRDDIVGIETSIIMHPKVWEASGHVAGFTDPLVDCKVTKQRYRADQLFFAKVGVHPEPVEFTEADEATRTEYFDLQKPRDRRKRIVETSAKVLAIVEAFRRAEETAAQTESVSGDGIGYVSALETERTVEVLREKAELLKRKLGARGILVVAKARDFTEATPEEVPLVPSPATGNPGDLTPARSFNMMFQTNVGAMTDASSVAYLRPETAQGMFVDFKNVVDTGRVKLPFGIAQIGKSFRNEITPRNFIFRSREFEQMEMEYFISEDADWAKAHREWIEWCKGWLLSIGLPASHLSEYDHPKVKLAFYSKGTTDIMFKYPFGVQELWGIAARGDYDLKQHATASGKAMDLFDEASKKKFVPHVIEPAVGVDRIFLAVLCAGYAEEDVTDEKGNVEKRTVLRLSPRIAPVKVAVLPLLKNKETLVGRAKDLYKKLQRRYAVFYDDGGNIGKRYRRQDEIGTPWCVTIDFDTFEKPGDTFTLRERDSMQQKRITEAELFALLEEKVY
ncbi:MAG: glycine--tRNA ligase [Opitutus sp.]|nr:glycine--tRNA ligase [Opitutus sp.]